MSIETEDVLHWWRTLIYTREFAFIEDQNLVKFHSQFEMYRLRYRAIADRMRKL